MKLFEGIKDNSKVIEALYYSMVEDFGYAEASEAIEADRAILEYLEKNTETATQKIVKDIDNLTGVLWNACEKHGFVIGFNVAIKLLGLELTKESVSLLEEGGVA